MAPTPTGPPRHLSSIFNTIVCFELIRSNGQPQAV